MGCATLVHHEKLQIPFFYTYTSFSGCTLNQSRLNTLLLIQKAKSFSSMLGHGRRRLRIPADAIPADSEQATTLPPVEWHRLVPYLGEKEFHFLGFLEFSQSPWGS